MDKNKKLFSIRIENRLYELLKITSKNTGLTMTNLISRAAEDLCIKLQKTTQSDPESPPPASQNTPDH